MRRPFAVLLVSVVAAAVMSTAPPAGGVAGFGDVDAGRFFTVPVQWMVDNAITTGTSPTCFSPDDPATRGQTAAFMWRMEGSPPPGPAHPFTDVVAPWQQDPVSWMFNNSITTGTSPLTYSPDELVTRGQLAAFLHRLEGSPPAPPPTQFPDVVKPWQITPVGWMLQEGITTGTSPTTFSPEDSATRGQLATFFYRYKSSPPVVVDPSHPAIPVCPGQVPGPATTGDLMIGTDTTLIQDHNGNIILTADGVTLDCTGHTITGTALTESAGTGIKIESRTGVTVKNCLVTNFFEGMLVVDSTGIVLLNNRTDSNNEGIRVEASSVTLTLNIANDNINLGFVVLGGTAASTLTGNVADNNGRLGFAVDTGAFGVAMIDNHASGNGLFDICSFGFVVPPFVVSCLAADFGR